MRQRGTVARALRRSGAKPARARHRERSSWRGGRGGGGHAAPGAALASRQARQLRALRARGFAARVCARGARLQLSGLGIPERLDGGAVVHKWQAVLVRLGRQRRGRRARRASGPRESVVTTKGGEKRKTGGKRSACRTTPVSTPSATKDFCASGARTPRSRTARDTSTAAAAAVVASSSGLRSFTARAATQRRRGAAAGADGGAARRAASCRAGAPVADTRGTQLRILATLLATHALGARSESSARRRGAREGPARRPGTSCRSGRLPSPALRASLAPLLPSASLASRSR
jgi:hypothetical protein